jgi:hypothetical protein
VLAGASLVCALAFAYTLSRYGRYFAPVYFVFPAGAGLLLASLWLRPSWKIALVMVVLSSGISLLVLEVLLESWIAGNPRRIAAASGREFDGRSPFEVIHDLRSRGIRAYPAFSSWVIRSPEDGRPSLLLNSAKGELLPLAGVANVTTVLCNESGEFIIYQADEHGFNNPKGLWSADALQLAMVGDSFTHGACVPPNQNFAGVLREEYPAILNLGIHGSGPLAELATLREYLPPLRPKFVVWFYYEENDLLDLVTEQQNAILLRYLRPDYKQGLLQRQAEIDTGIAAYMDRGLASSPSSAVGARLFTVLKLTGVRAVLGLSQRADPNFFDYESFGRVLAEAKRTTQSWGGTLYFVYLPGPSRYFSPASKGQYDATRQRVLSVVGDHGIPIIDVLPAFAAEGDPRRLFVYPGSHYNSSGYRVAASAVRDVLPPARP